MTDLFGEWVPRAWQFPVFDAALASPKQTIQLLTKRPAIAAQAMREWCQDRQQVLLPGNVWMGVSVGSQETADRFADDARMMGNLCDITWVSYEPALGPVAWGGWEFIQWLVIGGESGPKARPFHLEWALSAIAWCRQNDVAPYMKQMGSFPVSEESGLQLRTTGKGTDPSEWPKGLGVREFPITFPKP